MKRHFTMMALGAALTLAMAAPSFAQGNDNSAQRAAAHQRKATDPAAGSYDPSVPEGNYTNYSPSVTTGGPSADLGASGH